MFFQDKRNQASKKKQYMVDKSPTIRQDYYLNSFYSNGSDNFLIFAIRSQMLYFEKVSNVSALSLITDIYMEDSKYESKNIFILAFPFDFKQIIQLKKMFGSNIRFINFNFIKSLEKLYLFNYKELYNIQIAKNKNALLPYSSNLFNVQMPFQFPDLENTNQLSFNPTIKKARKVYQFVDDTEIEIHDHFSVLIQLRQRFEYYGIIIYSNDISRKKNAKKIKIATKQVLNNFDIYKFLVPLKKQLPLEKIEKINRDARKRIKELMKLSLTKYCDTVKNSEFKQLIFEMNLFVQRHSKYIVDLKKNWKQLARKITELENLQMMDDTSYQRILQSFHNIKKYNQNQTNTMSYNEKKTMAENVNAVFKAVNTYLGFMMNDKVNSESKKIEKMLFNIVFKPNQNGSCKTNVFSFYDMHDKLINTNESIFSVSSSTGSGKTRCSPFIFAIKTIEDNMNRPFIIMTQPRYSIIRTKISDFKEILGDSIKIITNTKKIVKLYERYSNNVKYHFVPKFNKPILFIMTAQSLLELIQKVDKMNINICSVTRFCLDEVHERSVQSDVLDAILAKRINETIKQSKNFPLMLLMMSATPDSRVFNCFDYVSQFKLPESSLYPVEEIKQQVDKIENVDLAVVDQTFNIITNMADRTIERGHIIIFTSGNSRMKSIKRQLVNCINNNWMLYNCCLKVIKKFDSLFVDEDVEKFYSNLDELIESETQKLTFFKNNKENILFILPIFYLGYVPNGQKEICLNPIPDHPNVIKIIFASNAIESSITMKNLVAVVDSGLHNKSTFNVLNGFCNLSEEPISVESQIQRKGRVGRIQPGVSVQITIKNMKPLELLPPAIKTSDISYSILQLRKIGYRLEDINNLPDKIEEKDIEKYLSDLESFNAISKDSHELTEFGEVLLRFDMISPFISAAILSVSGYDNKDDEGLDLMNIEENEIGEKELHVLLGCLISLIFNSSNLIANTFASKLREFFDKRSDIITLLRVIVDLAQFDKAEILDKESDYGLESRKVIKILEKLKQIGENLFFSKDEIQLDQPSYLYIEQKQKREEEKEFIWKKVFKSLNELVIQYASEDSLFSFITKLIEEIGKNKPEWIECRKVKFVDIIHASSTPIFIYKGDKALSKESIGLQMRPGSIGLDSPGKGIIFSITCNNNQLANGYLIHSEDDEFVPHPISVETSILMNNDFSLPLLERYFVDDVDNFHRFYNGDCDNNFRDVSFYKSQEKLTDSENQQIALISFVPKNEKALEIFMNAVKIIEELLPYVPSTVLISNTEIGCVVSLYGNGTQRIDSTVHLFRDHDYFAYELTKETIDYLHDNIDQLKMCPDVLSIAITDESISCPLSEDDEIRTFTQTSPKISYFNSNYVFNNTESSQNRLVIVSTIKIEMAKENDLLEWTIPPEKIFDSQENCILHKANKISERTITFRHAFYRLIITNYDSILQIKGRVPNKYDFEHIPMGLGPVSQIFYKCANKYINGDSLNSPLQFQGFYYRGKAVKNVEKMKEIPAHMAYIGNSCYCFDIKDEQNIDQVTNQVIELCQNEVYDEVYDEVIPVFSAFIRHRTHSNLSQKEFTEKVNSVLDQFGGVILKRYDYSEFVNKETYQGMIKVLMYGVDFTIPLAGMIKKAIQETEVGSIYNILNTYIDPAIFNDDGVQKSLNNWFSDNNIDINNNFSIINEGHTLNSIEKVMIEFKNNPPEIPFESYAISEEYNILQINHYMKFLNRNKEKKWYLNQITRTLYAPKEVKEEEVIEFLNHFQEYKNYTEEEYDDKLLWELYLHDEEEPTISRNLINIYTEEDKLIQKNYCVECLYQTFLFNLRKMYNKDDDKCSMIDIYNDIMPLKNISFVENHGDKESTMRVPLGQMLWTFAKESKIANQAKTWITAVAIRALRISSKITFCPLHPYILLTTPPLGEMLDCPIHSCPFCYCFECHQWHHKGKCEKEASFPAGSRICPFCKETIEKAEACNHIHCNCGKDFCYYCGKGFNKSSECYEHMDHEKHWDAAPDYLRFVLHQSVEDKVLFEFYEKYPQWKPKWWDDEI